MVRGQGFQHLHATQEADVFRPSVSLDEGVELVTLPAARSFGLVVSLSVDDDQETRTAYGAEVAEVVKLKSLDRTNMLRPRDVVVVNMPDGRTGVRYEVSSVNSTLVETQQAVGIRRAQKAAA